MLTGNYKGVLYPQKAFSNKTFFYIVLPQVILTTEFYKLILNVGLFAVTSYESHTKQNNLCLAYP